jgi:hypothetical protein
MKDEITAILREKAPLKAREIARKLDTDRRAVNQILHANDSIFVKDANDKWSLRASDELVVEFSFQGWLRPNQFEQVLNACGSPLDSACARIRFVFPEGLNILLEAAARLLALSNQLIYEGKSVSLVLPDIKVSAYLNRAGFFDLLNVHVAVFPSRPKSSTAQSRQGQNDSLVEVAKIDLANVDSNIPHRLREAVGAHANEQRQMGSILSELFHNICEHSSSPIPGFAALQLYKGGADPYVSTVFSDNGTGIVGTLWPTLPKETRALLESTGKDAGVALIEKVFSEGHLSRLRDAARGLGLKSTSDYAEKFNGSIVVRQETFEVTLTYRRGEKRFSHQLGLQPLRGTHICVKFYLTGKNAAR